MPISQEYREYVRDLFAAYGDVRIRSMFTGAGIFRDDLMFGLIIDEQVYLKVDDLTRADFESAGQGPFLYERKDGRIVAMSYYLIPEVLYDDAESLAEWATKAFAAAQRNAGKTSSRSRRKK